MDNHLTRFTRLELMEWSFERAESGHGMAFSRHTFMARIVWKDHAAVLHILVSRDIKVNGTHLMTSDGCLEPVRPQDVPYFLIDLAVTLALENSTAFVRETFSRAPHGHSPFSR
jgi:hypothetical protein